MTSRYHGNKRRREVACIAARLVTQDLHRTRYSLSTCLYQLLIDGLRRMLRRARRTRCIMVYVKMVKTTETLTHHHSTCPSQSLGKRPEFEVAVPLRQLNWRTACDTNEHRKITYRNPIWSSG